MRGPELSGFSAPSWDALAEKPPAGLKNTVFAAGTLGKLITVVRRSMEPHRNKAKTVSQPQGEHSPLQLWTRLVVTSWQSRGFLGIKNHANTRERLRMLLLAARCSYPS